MLAEAFKQDSSSVDNTISAEKWIPKEGSVSVEWQKTVSDTLVNAMAYANPSVDKKQLEELRGDLTHRGEVSWEVLADFWSKIGTGYGTTKNN